MNKQEAIEQLEWDVVRTTDFGRAEYVVVFEKVKSIISQIHEPQKVVIPKFVAEWIEDMKNAKIEFFEAQSNCMSDEIDNWYYNHADDLLRAWLDGYEVEKEKLYVVTDGNKLYLKKFEELNAVIIIDDVVGATDYAQHFVDKIKAQKAADELGWSVKEVE
ncbi:DUF1642 domain-containing protein [Streptococcus suis]|uniref:DUF1642 domain-containing protein n=1 Tax=Streptococcus suis TaxID=1307 RepID=UPI002AAD16DA|nr:DUF1642 domain-containing protein [Streptococcus suis]HEM4859008.1 DUF1642 domain-containing protein [Streptococcus suis]HEM4896816.1 DUF1642 domain-containing protein [Streptococcus suis]